MAQEDALFLFQLNLY